MKQPFTVILQMLISLALFVRPTQNQFVSFPSNTVAKFGDRVEFECSTYVTDTEYESFPLDWRFTSTNSSRIENIYHNGYITHSLTSKYAVSYTARGRFNLNMDSIDFSFAGKYTCSEVKFEGEGQPRSVAAELIVIASDPVCSSNVSEVTIEGSYIRMCCTVNYTGNWTPDLEWSSSNGRTIDACFVSMDKSSVVSSSVTMRLDSSDDGVTFTCKISFRPMTTINKTTIPGEALSTNIPLYQYVWSIKANVPSTPSSLHSSTIALSASGVIATIGLVALGLGIALTAKSCVRESSTQCHREITREASTQPQDYEMVTGLRQLGDPPLHQTTPYEERHSVENVDCECYSSLKRSSSDTFAPPAVYAQLQLYANTSSNDD